MRIPDKGDEGRMNFWLLVKILFFVSATLFVAGTICSFIFLRNRRKELALLLSSLLFSLLIAEIFLRLFIPQIMEHEKIYEPDPCLGWRLIPNKRVSISTTEGIHHYVKINSLGFRDNPPSQDMEKKRPQEK